MIINFPETQVVINLVDIEITTQSDISSVILVMFQNGGGVKYFIELGLGGGER